MEKKKLYWGYGYKVVYDVASSLKAKVSSVLKEKAMSGSHLGLILCFLYKANFLWQTLEM